MVKLILIDEQVMYRVGMQTALQAEPDFQIIGSFSDIPTEELNEEPDLVVVAANSGGLPGLDTLCTALDHWPASRVLLLAARRDLPQAFEAMKLGGAGVIRKDAPADELLHSLRAVADGESVWDAELLQAVLTNLDKLSKRSNVTLTPREREILQLIGQGLTTRQIATRLYLALGTAKNHVTNLLDKLELDDSAQAAIYAVQQGYTADQP